ncbi:hypothetical protein LA6_004755 [Marinibacterium anthonyi]|nr:hypothetical protein LA6_004755 [Marinibacterium anthonyi]
MGDRKFLIELDGDAALVLLEALSKLMERGNPEELLDDAERQRIFDLVADLERSLPEVLDPD